jgi:hypothetical protein
MQTSPMTPGMANLQAPANAMSLGSGNNMNQMQMANLAMGLMGSASPSRPEMPMMQMPQMQAASAGKDAEAFAQQYGLDALLQNQGQNDDMMRQRIQGLLALLGGQ